MPECLIVDRMVHKVLASEELRDCLARKFQSDSELLKKGRPNSELKNGNTVKETDCFIEVSKGIMKENPKEVHRW